MVSEKLFFLNRNEKASRVNGFHVLLDFLQWARDIALFQNAQPGFGAHPAAYLFVPEFFFSPPWRGEAAGAW